MNGPNERPNADSGEVAPIPMENEVQSYFLSDGFGNETGYVMKWSTSLSSYIISGKESHVSLLDYR